MSSPSPAPAPAPAPSPGIVTNIEFTDIRSVHFTCTWTNGSGDNRIVVISEDANLQPPKDGTEWEANPKFREEGQSKDSETGSYISWTVYKGNLESVTVFNLRSQTKYYLYFFEYDLINGINVYRENFTKAHVTTAGNETTSGVTVRVLDDLTELPIEHSDITFINRKSNPINKGRTDELGVYQSTSMPTGGLILSVTAPGYQPVTLRNVFIKDMKNNKSSYKTDSRMRYEVKLNKL